VLNLSSIGQINIPVKDLARASAFYQDVLGLKHLFSVPNMAFFDCGGLRLLLEVLPEREASIVYYKVADIQRDFEGLKSRGVTLEGEPHRIADMGTYDLWMTFFRDSEGNLLSLMSEVPKRHATM
jgi:predicted enzyme related to lactoylglutathione lyase